MGTKVGEAEVEIVRVEIQFGVRMPVYVIVKKTRAYGGVLGYEVKDLQGKFSGSDVDDMLDIGSRIHAEAICIVKKFEENEKELDLAT